MADQIAVVTVTTPSAAGTLDVTDPSITEPFSAAIVIFTRETSDGTDNAHVVLGVGFVDADDPGAKSEEQAMCMRADNDARTTPDTGTDHDNNLCINALPGPAGASVITAEYSASIAGGVRLNFPTVAAGPVQTKCTVILFAGLARASTGSGTSSVGGVAAPVGSPTTFEPHVVLFLNSNNAVNTLQNDAIPNLGVAVNTSPIEQVASFQSWDDATEPTDSDGYLRDDAPIAHFAGAITRAMEWASIAFTSTGFTATSTAASPDFHYLALRFSGNVRFAARHLTVTGSTGVQTFPLDFTPDLVFGMSSLLTSTNTLVDGATASAMGYFVTGRYGSRAYTAHVEEGKTNVAAASFNAHTRQEDVAVLTYEHAGTIAQRATWLGATGSGGFALDFSTATAGTLTVLAIQLVPNPPLPVRRPQRQRRARARIQRRAVVTGGRPIGPQPLRAGFWKAVQRIRRAFQVRLRRPPLPLVAPSIAGETTDEGSKGRIYSPGMRRGAVVQPSYNGHTFTPGLRRGRIIGPGVSPSDPDQ